ncbi:hypothetical protein C3L33_21445, partial [Rhododendron williamsianum]
MARASNKHGRDQAVDFQGFLNDLQDWEMSVDGKDKKVRSKDRVIFSEVGVVGEDRRPMTKPSTSDNSSTSRQYDYLRNYDSIRNLSSGFMTETSSPDAASEKELLTADAEFALRLEPNNEEVKRQCAEAKSLYNKELLKKASGALRSSVQGVEKAGKSKVEVNGHVRGVQSVSSSSQKMGAAAIQEDSNRVIERNQRNQELKASVQELAARAASLAKVEAAKNITPPNSAYQFEASWRGLAGDVTSPVALPQIFKNAFEEMDLSVNYLENLAKVLRFDMIIMCLSSAERADLHRIWDDIFCSNATPIEYAERLDKLRSRYCPKQ